MIEETPSSHGEGRTPNASIESSVFYKGKGSYVITFTNQGAQTAKNVEVSFDEVDGIYLLLDKEMLPIEFLKPSRNFQINAIATEGAPVKMMSHIKWREDDEVFEEDELVLFNH